MKILATAIAFMGWCSVAIAQDDPARTLFTNVHVFDGVSAERIENGNVLVEGNLIKSVSTDPIDTANATVIKGGGRTLMPGLIDAHVHISWVISSPYAMFDAPPDYKAALMLAEAEATLMRGFTSVSDNTGQV